MLKMQWYSRLERIGMSRGQAEGRHWKRELVIASHCELDLMGHAVMNEPSWDSANIDVLVLEASRRARHAASFGVYHYSQRPKL